MTHPACSHCAGNGYVPDPFGDASMQAVPCPACAHRGPYPFTALVGTEQVEGADTLAELLDLLRQVFEPGLGEDVAVWQGGRQLVAVFRSDGRVVWLDRARVPV